MSAKTLLSGYSYVYHTLIRLGHGQEIGYHYSALASLPCLQLAAAVREAADAHTLTNIHSHRLLIC